MAQEISLPCCTSASLPWRPSLLPLLLPQASRPTSPPLPFPCSSLHGQQRTMAPLSQLGLAITQGRAGAQKIPSERPTVEVPLADLHFPAPWPPSNSTLLPPSAPWDATTRHRGSMAPKGVPPLSTAFGNRELFLPCAQELHGRARPSLHRCRPLGT